MPKGRGCSICDEGTCRLIDCRASLVGGAQIEVGLPLLRPSIPFAGKMPTQRIDAFLGEVEDKTDG